jgi:hypothetical protein
MDADASHYQARKGNEDDWAAEPSPRPRSERRRLASMVSVRFSPEEAALVRRQAEAAGLSLSGYVRERALGQDRLRSTGPQQSETRGSEDSAMFNISARIAATAAITAA